MAALADIEAHFKLKVELLSIFRFGQRYAGAHHGGAALGVPYRALVIARRDFAIMVLYVSLINHAVIDDVRAGHRRKNGHLVQPVDELLPVQSLFRLAVCHEFQDFIARLQTAVAIPEKRHHVARQVGVCKLLRIGIALRSIIHAARCVQINQPAVCFGHQPLHAAHRGCDLYRVEFHPFASSYIIDYILSILFSHQKKCNC